MNYRVGKRYIATARGQVHAQECGVGDRALVFLSITSFGGVILDEVLPLLAARGWRVLALDLMGYGRSDKRDAIWLVEDFADNIEEAIAGSGCEAFGLICGHFSSWIGIEIGRRRSTRVAGVVLDGSPYFSAARRTANLKAPSAPPKAWRADGAHAVEYWGVAHRLLTTLHPDFVLPSVPDARFRERYIALLEAISFEPGTMEAANRFDIDAALADLHLPTLLMCSDTDWNLPHHATLRSLLPDALEVRLQGVHPLHDLLRDDRALEYVEPVDRFFRTIARA